MAKKRVQIIPPSNELKRKAVNFKKGLDLQPTPDILRKIEEVVHRSSDKFITEVAGHLSRLRPLHAEAQAKKTQRPAYLEAARDASLTIKGLGGTFGYPLLTGFAKSMNDFSKTIDTPTDKQMMILGLHIDALYVTLAQRIAGEGGKIEGELLQAFRVAIDKFKQA